MKQLTLRNVLNANLGKARRIFTINIEITGLCGSKCEYCHFFLKHDRKRVAYNMPINQFIVYCTMVKYWISNSGGETNYRFSGGDPLALKDELFVRAKLANDIIGVKPFVLTHGYGLKGDWFKKALDSGIGAVYLSIENPVQPCRGSLLPNNTINYISKYDSDELPVKLGVCLVPNENFKDLLYICDWFYDRVNYIPPLAEINYDAYKSPTENQWGDLERSLDKVLSKYFGKVHLNLFHSVSPELIFDSKYPYVFNLGLKNELKINSDNIFEKAIEIAHNISNINYPKLGCTINCDWSDFCVLTKWYWQGDANNLRDSKVKDYCRFKKILNGIYYRNIIDKNYDI